MLTLIGEEDEEEKCKEIPITNLIIWLFFIYSIKH